MSRVQSTVAAITALSLQLGLIVRADPPQLPVPPRHARTAPEVAPYVRRLPPVRNNHRPRQGVVQASFQSAPVAPPVPKAPDTAGETRDRPPTVMDYSQPHLWNMGLGEAIYLALCHNPQIAIQQIEPHIARTQILQELARFDGTLEANQHWSINQFRIANTVDTFGTGSDMQRNGLYGTSTGRPEQLAISRTLPSGLAVRGGISTAYTDTSPVGAFNAINPAWRTNASLRFSQPLARGRGRRIQTMPIQIARTQHQSSELTFLAFALRLVRDVEVAYWNLVFAHQDLEVRRQDVEDARLTLDKESQKLALGESSRPEMGEARLHYHNQVELYQQRKTNVLERERAFRELLGLPGFDTRRILAVLPQDLPITEFDWQSSVAIMDQMHPELAAQRLASRAAQLEFELTKNGCLPELNFEGVLTRRGIANRLDQSVERLIDDDDYQWLAGFSYSRDVNRSRIRSEIHRAHLNWTQQRARTREMEYAAVHRLQRAFEQLHHKRDKVQRMRGLRDAAKERFDAYQERFNLGDLDIELFLRARAQRSDAELRARLAKVEYMQSLAEFEFERGTLLLARSVLVRGGDPEITPAAAPEPNLLTPPPSRGRAPQPYAPNFQELKERTPSALPPPSP